VAAIKYWVWLSALGISTRAKAALVRHYQDAEQAYFASDAEYKKLSALTANDIRILEKRDVSVADAILADCQRLGLELITMQDAAYPSRLRNISDPPVVLYVKGKMPDVDNVPAIAVIGTRQPSAYGIKMARKLSYETAKSGGTVISMLSEGIDRECAKAALMAGGQCIGVLGTAHDKQSQLYRDIAQRGALISEYPPGRESRKHFFRERNRIASGLCHGGVVVEAPEKSGTLIFAAQALEQGREVFAVPGNADAPNSIGTIELIKQGAKPVTCAWDVLEEFEYLFPGKLHKLTEPVHVPETEAQETTIKDIDKPKSPVYIDLRGQLKELSAEQLQIISAIEGKDTHIDDLIERTGLSTAKVLAQLTILEIKGYVRRSTGRRISLNIKSK